MSLNDTNIKKDVVLILKDPPKTALDWNKVSKATKIICFCSISEKLKQKILQSSKVEFVDPLKFHEKNISYSKVWSKINMKILKADKRFSFSMGTCARSEYSSYILNLCMLVYSLEKNPKAILSSLKMDDDLSVLCKIYNKRYNRYKLFVIGRWAREFFSSLSRSIIFLSRAILHNFVMKKKVELRKGAIKEKIITFSLAKNIRKENDVFFGNFLGRSDILKIAFLNVLGGLQDPPKLTSIIKKHRELSNNGFTVFSDAISIFEFFKLIKVFFTLSFKIFYWSLPFNIPSKEYIFYVAAYLENQRLLFTVLSHMILFKKMEHFFSGTNNKKLLTTHFEYPVGRIIFNVFSSKENCRSYGLQHGLITEGKWPYKVSGDLFKDKILKRFQPNFYLLNGQHATNVMDLNERNYHFICQKRDIKNSTNNQIKLSKLLTNLLLVMDLHTSKDRLNELFSTILRDIKCKGTLYLKPHPRDDKFQEKIEKVIWLNGDSVNIKIVNEEILVFLIKNPIDMVIGESSAALLDAYLLGKRVYVARDPSKRFIMDPFADQNILVRKNKQLRNSYKLGHYLFNQSDKSISTQLESYFYDQK